MLENKLWREVYLMQNPITLKKQDARPIKLKNINPRTPVVQQSASSRDSLPEIADIKIEAKEVPISKGSPSMENNKVLLESKMNGQVNQNLEERIKELERKNMQRQIEYNKLKFTFQMEMERKDRQSQEERLCQLKLLEHFIRELEQFQSKRLERKKLTISSQRVSNSSGSMRLLEGKQCERKTNQEIESQSQIQQKSLILAIVKELHYIYMRIPQACEESDAKLRSIFNSHEQIFLQVINNKIKLNSMV